MYNNIYIPCFLQGQVCQKPRKSLRSPDHKVFHSRLGTASDSDSDDGDYGRGGKKVVTRMPDPRVGLLSPSESGSDFPGFPPQARRGMADTPSSGYLRVLSYLF